MGIVQEHELPAKLPAKIFLFQEGEKPYGKSMVIKNWIYFGFCRRSNRAWSNMEISVCGRDERRRSLSHYFSFFYRLNRLAYVDLRISYRTQYRKRSCHSF